jgi:hypothetical protein
MRRASFRSLALGAILLASPAAAAEYLGSHTWRPGWHGAGGFSALWLGKDGSDFVALSDRGHWVEGRLSRDGRGTVSGVTVSDRGPLRHSSGRRLRGTETDSEAIARIGPDWFIAFESQHRVMRHPGSVAATPERMARPRGMRLLALNAGIEALAAGPDGTLYAVPEDTVSEGRPFPCWRWRDGAWEVAFRLRRDGRYLPVSADIFDGRLYLLERDFVFLGFRTRLRSFDLEGADERLEMESGLGAHDNLEGLSIWRDGAGALRATMISDNNLRALQRTEFVDYRLD